MTTIRISHKKNYTCIHNKAIRDEKLSYKARGIHHLLLSYPDDWVVNICHLVNGSEEDGRDAVRSGLQELERAGYLIRNQLRNTKGQFANATYTVFEFPTVDMPETEKPETETRKRETVAGKSNSILNTELRSTNIRSNNNYEVTISPPTPSNEGGEKKPLSPDEKDKSFPDREITKKEISNFSPERIVSPTEFEINQTPVVESEVIPEETVTPACNTLATQNNLKGFGKPEDPWFGKKQNPHALNKQRAAEHAIAGGYFESVEQEDAFFVQVQGFLKATNPSWNPTQIMGTAVNQTNRLRTGQTRAEDRQNFALFLSGKMQQVQGLSYDHKTVQRDEAEKKRKEKEAFYAQFQDPNATSKSKLLQKEMGQC